jgi:hypothetical protein
MDKGSGVQYTSGKQKAPKGTRSEKGNIDRRMGYTSEPVYRCDEDSDDYAANYMACYAQWHVLID